MERAPTSLVGRDAELTRLDELVADATADGGALVVVGEAGVGKTVLLDHAATSAAARGSQVLHGSGVEYEAEIGFAALHQLIQPVVDELDRLAPQHRDALQVALGLQVGPAPDRLALANALIALLRLVAGDGALLVVVDDLQWVDPATVTLLGMVGRRLAGSRVGLLGAVRTGEGSLAEHGGLDELVVDRLDGTAAEALLAASYPELSTRDRARVLGAAEGNPLALVELPRGLGDPGAHQPSSVGRRLRDHFRRRLATLPETTRDRLLLAALSTDDAVPADTLDGPTGVDVWDEADLELAVRAGLVRVDLGRVRLRHPLVRSTVVEASVHAQRRQAHLTIAARWPDGSPQQVWHRAQAASGHDEALADLLERSSLDARSRGDAAGSVRLLLRAAALSPSAVDRDRRTRHAAFLGIDVTGELRPAPAGGGSTLDAVLGRAAYLVQTAGDLDTVTRLLTAALVEAPSQTDGADPLLAEALFVLAAAAFFRSEAGVARPFHDRVAALEPAPPELLTLLGATFLEPVGLGAAELARLDRAISLLDEHRDPVHVARLGMSAVYVDRVGGCSEALSRVVDDGRAGGAVTSALEAMTFLACDAFLTGDWDRARSVALEGSALAGSHGYTLLGGILAYAEAVVAAGRGDHVRVADLTSDLVGWAAPSGIGYVVQLAAHADALAALGRGDHDLAYARALEVCTPQTVPPHVPQALWVVLDLVEAAVRSGRTTQAAAHVAHLVEAGVAGLSDRLAFVVAGARAMAAADDGMRHAYDAALALPRSDRWPFVRARVQLSYGERLRRSRSVADARIQLQAAQATFDRLGARPWVERATGELRASGLRVGPTAGDAAARLSPQQREIAMLAAEGLTNRQIGERLFLSPRTVGTHLYQLFPKLGITSRAALRDALDARADD